MPIVVRNLSLALDQPEDLLPEAVARKLRVETTDIRSWAILRRALDARKKDIRFVYHVEVALDEPQRAQRSRISRLHAPDVAWAEPEGSMVPRYGTAPLPNRPVVIGFGPGGMFAALRLAQMGYRPLVLERGREVRRRHRDILQRFYRERDFDPSSNLLFGEGGAGTYSDGKLYTRVNHPLCRFVLETFYHHGADPQILVDTRPHLGSDRLPTVCMRIRRKIESLGGEVRFERHVDDLRVSDRGLTALHVCGPGLPEGGEWLSVGPTVLSVGHSARDTIRLLAAHGVQIDPKPFQIGVRMEHHQEMVDHWQYGSAAGHRRLGAAEFHAVARNAAGEHGDVFSFCMCPGGMILPSNESPGLIVTNGASRSQRSGRFANSGLVITLQPADLGLTALGAIDFQQRWERLAFERTEGTYRVPAQRASDFLVGRPSDGTLETSYPLGGQWTDVRTVVPDVVTQALLRALPMLDAQFPGLAGPEALVTGPETRASAPFRLTRDTLTRQAVRTPGLYPVGEGAGYAGGIVSAAVDGIRSADAIVETYAPPR